MEINVTDGINNAGIFIALATDEYFDDARCFSQALHALTLEKPFLVLLRKGVKIPKDFPMPEDAIVKEWQHKDELKDIVLDGLTEIEKMEELNVGAKKE